MDSLKKREPLPDMIRGFAILLVILGHCIQEGSGDSFREGSLYFYDRIYQFLYSFHMPLFMLLSGYFTWGSVARANGGRERVRLLGRRGCRLLLPVLGWTIFEKLWTLVWYGKEAAGLRTFSGFAISFGRSFLSTGWFLWAVFWCSLIVVIMHCYFRDSVLLYGVGFLIMFVTPDGLGLGAYKYMLPYFLAGFYFRGCRERERLGGKPEGAPDRKPEGAPDRKLEGKPDRKLEGKPDGKAEGKTDRKLRESLAGKLSADSWLWILLSGAAFGVLFLFFDENSMIYLSGYKLIGKEPFRQLGIDLYRMVIGFAGSGFFILLWKKAAKSAGGYSFPVLCALGRNSLGLYMVSGEICLLAGWRFRELLFPSHLLNLAEAAGVTAAAYLLCVILRRIPVLWWLTGGKLKK